LRRGLSVFPVWEVWVEIRQQDVEKRERGKPVILHSRKSVGMSTLVVGLRMQWALLDSPQAFFLPQKCPEELLEHLVQCSQMLRIVGKTEQQHEGTMRPWAAPHQAEKLTLLDLSLCLSW
jgi:hypothetical protein